MQTNKNIEVRVKFDTQERLITIAVEGVAFDQSTVQMLQSELQKARAAEVEAVTAALLKFGMM